MIAAPEALARLRDGNRRFVAHGSAAALRPSAAQEPFAIILGCSDARVPAELIFAQGFGDLFVIRVAGNIVAPSQIGSVEFAAERFGTRLAVVLGHTQCGAVAATLDAVRRPDVPVSPNLRSIVDRIRPAVAALRAGSPEALYAQAVRANVAASVRQLRHGSALLERCIAEHALQVVGAEYHVESGVVEFFEGD